MRIVLCTVLSLLHNVGCAGHQQHVGLVDVASVEAEAHQIWTRPLEVGFEMGRYIEAESTQRDLFGCVALGENVTRSSVPVMGGVGELTPNVQYTIAQAVADAGVDGMYVLFVEEQVQWTGLVKETTTMVKGRALKLEDFGSVDQERATRVRVEEAGRSEVAP